MAHQNTETKKTITTPVLLLSDNSCRLYCCDINGGNGKRLAIVAVVVLTKSGNHCCSLRWKSDELPALNNDQIWHLLTTQQQNWVVTENPNWVTSLLLGF